MIQQVCKRHVFAKFCNIMEIICGAVNCLASEVMINWPRSRRMARNNGFEHIVVAGYNEKYT